MGITYVSTFFEDSRLAGTFSIFYNIDVLDKMISPLYEDIEGEKAQNFNVYIYANSYDREYSSRLLPTYDKPVYKKSVIDLPEADFQKNIDNIFVETVFTSEINGIEYQIYS